MGVLVGSWSMKVVLILVVSLLNINVTVAKDINLEWEVEYKRWSPDGVEGVVLTINGEFPGPTIRARAGDTVNVNLTNKLHTEGVVIHWHGIRQKGTPWADGTASISQCAINPGETYAYTFQVDKAGTYFYHGHYGMQRSAGLYGSLIVNMAEGEKEIIDYDEELEMILLSDWWHKSSHEQEIYLSSKPMTWIGEPQSLLINGRGQFGCSLAAHVSKEPLVPCKLTGDKPYTPYNLTVLPNRTYRLRIASTTALAALNLAIGGNHEMEVVEADGNYVKPFTVKSIDIYSGESYSVLLKTDKDPSKNYWISINVIGREPHTPPGLAILRYLPDSPPPAAAPLPGSPSPVAAPLPDSSLLNLLLGALLPNSPPPVAAPNSPPPVAAPDSPPSMAPLLPDSPLPAPPEWNNVASRKDFLKKILARDGTPPPPLVPLQVPPPVPPPVSPPVQPSVPLQHYRRIVLLNTQNYINGHTKWSINNISLALPATPYLGSIRYSLTEAFDRRSPPDDFDPKYNIMIPPTNKNSTTGNKVYTLESGSTVDVILQNANMLAQGSSEIHPWHLHGHDFWVLGYGEGKFTDEQVASFNLYNPPLRNTAVLFPHGWTALRFVADNPGVWAFHCHIEPHLHMGMGVVLAEGVDEIKKLNIPNDGLACGLTAKFLMNNNIGQLKSGATSFMLSVSKTFIIRIIAVPLLWLCIF